MRFLIYQKILKENGALDFDDLILKTVELFKKNTNILEKYQNKFQYIMIDEYHFCLKFAIIFFQWKQTVTTIAPLFFVYCIILSFS